MGRQNPLECVLKAVLHSQAEKPTTAQRIGLTK